MTIHTIFIIYQRRQRQPIQYTQATVLSKTHFWIDILLNEQGCMMQFKLLVCDTQAQTGILLSKMALEQLQTWQDYSTNMLYVKQTAIPLHAIQNIELLPE